MSERCSLERWMSALAVLYPVYKSTYERGDGLESPLSTPTTFYRDHVIAWAKDFGRSIDYVETRKDLDARRIALYGASWGAKLVPLLAAVEDRVKVNVLVSGGFGIYPCPPEVDPFNFAPFARQPTLMINGKYDSIFPVPTTQLPLFQLLGSPAKDKPRDRGRGPPAAQRPGDEGSARLVGPVLRWILHDEDDARDAFSEFAEVLWRTLPSFRWEASLRTWAYRLAWSAAQHVTGEAWRRLRHRFVTGEASRIAEEIRTKSYQRLERRREALQKLVATLPLEDRTLVTLRVGQGLSWAEIAEILASEGSAVDESTVAKRFSRLKARLSRMAEEQGLLE